MKVYAQGWVRVGGGSSVRACELTSTDRARLAHRLAKYFPRSGLFASFTGLLNDGEQGGACPRAVQRLRHGPHAAVQRPTRNQRSKTHPHPLTDHQGLRQHGPWPSRLQRRDLISRAGSI